MGTRAFQNIVSAYNNDVNGYWIQTQAGPQWVSAAQWQHLTGGQPMPTNPVSNAPVQVPVAQPGIQVPVAQLPAGQVPGTPCPNAINVCHPMTPIQAPCQMLGLSPNGRSPLPVQAPQRQGHAMPQMSQVDTDTTKLLKEMNDRMDRQERDHKLFTEESRKRPRHADNNGQQLWMAKSFDDMARR